MRVARELAWLCVLYVWLHMAVVVVGGGALLAMRVRSSAAATAALAGLVYQTNDLNERSGAAPCHLRVRLKDKSKPDRKLTGSPTGPVSWPLAL